MKRYTVEMVVEVEVEASDALDAENQAADLAEESGMTLYCVEHAEEVSADGKRLEQPCGLSYFGYSSWERGGEE